LPEIAKKEELRVLLAQIAPVDGDLAANCTRLEGILAAAPGADLAVFPELFLSGYAAGTSPAMGRRREDEPLRRVRAAAAAADTALITGFAELGDDGELYDSALCVDRDGSLAGVHRKAYRFGAERKCFRAGDQLHVFELAGWRIAPLICFEIEFPEPARAVVLAGAELLVTVAANMAPYRGDHDLASRARALDNRVPHVYVNRVGTEAGLEFVGGSQVIDAGGRLLAAAGATEEILLRTLRAEPRSAPDLDYLNQLREPLPVIGGDAKTAVSWPGKALG
jgi:predicted amidohydrolase